MNDVFSSGHRGASLTESLANLRYNSLLDKIDRAIGIFGALDFVSSLDYQLEVIPGAASVKQTLLLVRATVVPAASLRTSEMPKCDQLRRGLALRPRRNHQQTHMVTREYHDTL